MLSVAILCWVFKSPKENKNGNIDSGTVDHNTYNSVLDSTR